MNRSIGIVGGGLMGCLAALVFARRGDRVSLFEHRDRLMAGASAGNEGKIHRGFTYGLDETGETPRLMHRYGAQFQPALERILGRRLDDLFLHRRQCYAVHRDSAMQSDSVAAHMAAMARLSENLGETQFPPRKLGRDERESLFSDRIAEAWEVAETTLDCPRLVRLMVAAIEDEPAVEVHTCTRVGAICDSTEGAAIADASGKTLGTFDLVVNAAWDGLPALENEAGSPVNDACLRAKAGFIAAVPRGLPDKPVSFCFGAFGDIVPLDGDTAYLSWYPACLMGFTLETHRGIDWFAEVSRQFGFCAAYARSCAAFRELIPGIAFADAPLECRSGPILAAAKTDITDPASGLHRRTDFGISRRGSHFAVNTGKLACAPALALELDALIA